MRLKLSCVLQAHSHFIAIGQIREARPEMADIREASPHAPSRRRGRTRSRSSSVESAAGEAPQQQQRRRRGARGQGGKGGGGLPIVDELGGIVDTVGDTVGGAVDAVGELVDGLAGGGGSGKPKA